jgi:hypothetical protein
MFAHLECPDIAALYVILSLPPLKGKAIVVMDTVTFWSVGVEKRRETSHNPRCPVRVIFGLRRSLNEKHR